MRMPCRTGLFLRDRLIQAYQGLNIVKFLRDRENEFPMMSDVTWGSGLHLITLVDSYQIKL